jgi:hypothetical protein
MSCPASAGENSRLVDLGLPRAAIASRLCSRTIADFLFEVDVCDREHGRRW